MGFGVMLDKYQTWAASYINHMLGVVRNIQYLSEIKDKLDMVRILNISLATIPDHEYYIHISHVFRLQN